MLFALFLSLADPDIPALLQKADTALQEQRYETAESLYREILEHSPDSFEAKYGLGRSLAFSRSWNEAVQVFTELLADHPHHADVLLSRGLVYTWKKEYRKAEEDLRRVVDLVPNYADAWSALGNVYLQTQEYRQAIDAYSHWVELAPESPDPYLARAKAYTEAGELSLARKDLQTAQEKGADNRQVKEMVSATEERLLDRSWEAAFTYTFNSLSSGLSDWHQYGTRITRKFESGSISFEGSQYDRFDERDVALRFDGYWDLWTNAYGNLQFQYSEESDFLPETDTRLEIFQGIGAGWEVSANYRHMYFAHNRIDSYGATLAKYLGKWYLRGGTVWTPEGDEDNITYVLMGRYYFTDDNFLEVSGSRGEEVVTVGPGPILESRDTTSFGIRGQHFFTPRWGLFLGYDYFDIEDVWDRHGVSSGILIRW